MVARTSCSRLLIALGILSSSVGLAEEPKPQFPGPTERGFLLPNGWTLTPAGEHVPLSDLPLNILPLADGRHALVATSGFNRHELSLIDLERRTITAVDTVRESWFGLAHDPETGKLWWSGGGGGQLHTFQLEGTGLIRTSPTETSRHALPAAEREAASKHFRSGLALNAARKVVYSLDIEAGQMIVLDAKNATDADELRLEVMVDLGGRPYDVVLGPRGDRLYVSDWSRRQVLVVDAKELRVVARIPVGEHPNQMALHREDGRLFVACASSNCVSVIDTARGVVTETVFTTLFPRSPEGCTPCALALAPDGKTLYVANADNNCVAVVDVTKPSESQVKGFIPTGWYPTALAVTPDGKQLLVGVGKGNQTKANPIAKDAEGANAEGPRRRALPYPYIGTTLSGTLSIVPLPDEKQLVAYTEAVYKNCPYSDEQLTTAPHPEKTAIPNRLGDPSPIEHVIYIIKENRTYDQVFSDLPRGNGDPSLLMFGREVTPNHHKLAEEFVILDNLYCNGQVSRDGHPWSTMAYHTDYVARDWLLTYSDREGIDDDDEGNLQRAPSGYIWDACGRMGLSYRSYGEYGRRVSQPDGSLMMEGAVPGLVGHMSPDYGVSRGGGRTRDTDNVETFLREFREYEKNDKLPRFIVMSLGEDHTRGTQPGAFTPEACVGSNDLALGKLVEAVSQSKYWPKIAIFVIEDDAQNGPDHVDAHRTIGLVISPYAKRKHLDSAQYSTASMLRTIELILGIPPLSQFDAAARPMFASFQAEPDLAPYTHEPARIDLESVNSPLAYGAERSLKMDFSEYDRINDFELNEILWRAVRGVDAPLPPAVRRAIAWRPSSGGEAGE